MKVHCKFVVFLSHSRKMPGQCSHDIFQIYYLLVIYVTLEQLKSIVTNFSCLLTLQIR